MSSWLYRVDIMIGNGEEQDTIMHEMGHVFGLGDEYITDTAEPVLDSGTGGVLGGETEHHDLAEEMGADPSVFEMNDSLMSVGNVVRPEHYATFGFALEDLTQIDDWQLDI